MVKQNKIIIKFRTLVYILIIPLIILGCGSDNRSKNNQKINKDYANSFEIAKKNFPDSMISHFPEFISKPCHIYLKLPNGGRKSDRYGVTLLFQTTNVCLEQVKNEVDSCRYEEIHYSDKRSLIITLGTDEKSEFKTDSLIPLPNIPEIFKNPAERKFKISELKMDHYKFYVIGYAKGQFVGIDYLTDGKGLPEEWKNGYSRGIAINEKANELIYWLEIW